MKVVLVVVCSFLICLNFGYKKSECKDFKTGKFTLADKKLNSKYIIERNDSIQIEKEPDGDFSKYRVHWVNDCEYELTIIDGSYELMKFYTGQTLIIRIVETYKDSYKFEAWLKGSDKKQSQIVKRIK